MRIHLVKESRFISQQSTLLYYKLEHVGPL